MTAWPTYRELVPSDLILVAVDTNLLRDLCYEDPDWLLAFSAMSQDGYAFCFTDIAAAEIVAQVSRGSMSRAELAKGIERARAFVYARLPFLPGPRELNVMTGAVHGSDEWELSEVAAHLRGLWDLLGDASAERHVYEDKGKQYSFSLDHNTAGAVLSAERDEWSEQFERLRLIPKATLSPADNLSLLRNEVDKEPVRGIPLSARLDLQLKYLYGRYCHHNALASAYNPRAKRSRNDGVDFNLLYALLGPALVVTRDERLLASLRDIESYQTSWVMGPEQLAEAWASGMGVQPVWQNAV